MLTKKFYRRRTEKVGLDPGTPLHVGRQKMESVKISLMEYDQTSFFEKQDTDDIAFLADAIATEPVTWINVAGLHQIDFLEEIGIAFGIHPLLLEDILNTEQRPKIEQFENYVYMILKLAHWKADLGDIEMEQISIVLGTRFVLTFQEQEEDVFDPLRQRIRAGTNRIRQSGADYLAYSILDIVVDNYFIILENLGEQIETVEFETVTNPDNTILSRSMHRQYGTRGSRSGPFRPGNRLVS